MRSAALLLLVHASLLSACATFESGELPGLDAWPPETAPVRLDVALEIEGLPEKFHAGFQHEWVQVLEESGRFGRVTVDPEAAVDRRVRMVVDHERQSLPLTRTLMLMCAFTLGVLPARAAWDFEIRAEILDGNGSPLGAVDRSVGAATWVGWIPLLALPFAGAGLSPLARDTMRSVVAEGVASGWL